MSCLQTLSSIATDCSSNRGGVKKIYAINVDKIGTITVTQGAVTGITLAAQAPAAGDGFYEYAFRKGAASSTTTSEISEENGTKAFNTVLSARFARQETAKRVSLLALAGSETYVIYEENNQKRWLLGYDNPVTATSLGGETGAAFGDANQYTIELTDNSSELPMEVTMSDTDFEALLDANL